MHVFSSFTVYTVSVSLSVRFTQTVSGQFVSLSKEIVQSVKWLVIKVGNQSVSQSLGDRVT